VREMSEEEIRQVGENGPSIDSIQLAEFESQAELKEWLPAEGPGVHAVGMTGQELIIPLCGVAAGGSVVSAGRAGRRGAG
jgi:hypothetical protein